MLTNKRLFLIVALAAFVLISSSPVNAKEDKEEQKKELKKIIEEVAEKAKDEKGFVKELFEKLEEKKPKEHNVVVLNLKQDHETKLYGMFMHEEVEKFGNHYGVWIFKCGKFENDGNHGPEHWAFSKEHVYVIDKGEEAIFYEPECSNHDYREKDQKKDD